MSSTRNAFDHMVILMVIGAVIGGTIAKPPSRINEGRFADDDEFRGAVMLAPIWDYIPFCGGAIIGPRHILTAAHCVENNTINDINIRAGIHRMKDSSIAVQRSIAEIIIHPDYISIIPRKRGAQNDLAILVLEKPLPIGDNVQQFMLPTEKPKMNYEYYLAGWGDTYPGVTGPQTDLKVLSVQLGDAVKCSAQIPKTFCAYSAYGGACSGDSGSPLHKDNYLYGIASMAGCVLGSQIYFANVYEYVDWINGIISQNP